MTAAPVVTLRRICALGVTALALYGLAPVLGETYSAWPRVRRIEPAWFAVMVVAQAGSLLCLAKVQALCIGGSRIAPVATSSLVSGALGRVLPGGTATAAATQYAMLLRGRSGAAIGVGLAAAAVLQLAVLSALPLLAVPAVAFGLDVPRTLATTTVASAALLVAMIAASALVYRSEAVIRAVARVIVAGRRQAGRAETDSGALTARLITARDELARVFQRGWKLAVGVTAARWLLDYLALLCALVAIGADVSWALTLLAYAAVQLVAQVPVTPGGLGVVEAGLTASLTLAGAAPGEAALATLAYRLVSYWLVVGAGLVTWLAYRRRDLASSTNRRPALIERRGIRTCGPDPMGRTTREPHGQPR